MFRSQNTQKSSADILQEATKSLNDGDKSTAQKLLTGLVRTEPQNAAAWYLLALAIEDRLVRIKCLEEVLRVKPNNLHAQKWREDLLGYSQLSAEITYLREQLALITETETRADIKRKTEQRRADLATLTAEIKTVTTQKTKLDTEIGQRTAELEGLRSEVEEVAKQKRESETERDRIRAELTEVEKIKAQQAELEAQINVGRIELTELDERIRQAQNKLTRLENDIERKREDWRKELAALKVELKTLTAQKTELDTETVQRTTELARLATEVEEATKQTDAELQHQRQLVKQGNDALHMLRLQMGQPLWQATLRANLDAAELPPHTDWVLTALEKTAPEAAYAFRLEIAARTAQTVVPKGDNVNNEARLFSGVVEARRAEQAGKISAALEHLCAGWEAMLSDNTPSTTPEPAAPLEPATPEPLPDDVPHVQVPEVMATPVSSVSRNAEVLVSGAWSTLTLNLGSKVIVIDPGGENYTIPSTSPDMIIVTHAHADHTQHLPALSRAFPGVPVIMTPETSQLLTLASTDWQSLHRWVSQELPFGTPLDIAGLKITLHPAGHLLGAAMAEIMGDVHILVTGDFSLRPVGSVPPANPALFQRPYDLVFMEAVHAFDATFPTASLLHDRQSYLVDRVNHAIESGYTRILILAAALGDAQEVYQSLCEACQTPAAPLRQYEIYLKGLAWNVAQHYVKAGIWQSPLPDEPSDFPAHSIIICREAEAHTVRRQLEQTQYGVIFEPYKSAESSLSTEQNRRYQVDLHASLEELQTIGQQVQCTVLGLYHRETAGSPLEKTLRAAGKQFVNVASADLVPLELK